MYPFAHGLGDVDARHRDGSVGTPAPEQQQFAERVERRAVPVGDGRLLRGVFIKPRLPRLRAHTDNGMLL